MADDKKTDKVFDVARPGKTAPDATSRPVIVGHGSMLKDPMVSDKTETEDVKPAEATKEELKPSKPKVLAPLNDTKTEPAKDEPAAAQPESTDTAKEETTEKAEDQAAEPTSSDAAIVDAVVDQAADKKKDQAKDEISDEEKIRREHVQSLINDKTYFLPIGKATRKRQARTSIIVLLVLLVAAGGGGYYAYTMGLLDRFK